MRTRRNGAGWGEWQRVRTRNFADGTHTVDGLGRWKCLVGSEFAWALVERRAGQWHVQPQSVSVYDEAELPRLLPEPGPAQASGTEAVPAYEAAPPR